MEEGVKDYRAEIMGIATIMIILGHSVFYGEGYVDYGYLNDLITLGYSGVDIFLFLSGFGLTFSMQNNKRETFWKHRIERLLPSCICIWILNILVHIKSLSLMTLLNPLVEVYYGGYWFIGFLLIAYILFPWLYDYILKRNGYIIFFQFVLLSIICLLPYIIRGTAVSCNPHVCIICRIPIFIMGILFAMRKFDIINSPYVNAFLLLVGLFSLAPWYMTQNLGGNRVFTTYYCFIFLTAPVLFFYSIILRKFGWANSLFKWLGNLSLEIYLYKLP